MFETKEQSISTDVPYDNEMKPNILLIVLDSVRARNCGLYGHENETTPFLSSLAEECTVFRQARSPSIHSISSHASIFSGYHVEEHQVTEHESRLRPEHTIWGQLSRDFGYETGVFTPNVVITRTSNLCEPFDNYVGPRRRKNRKRIFDGGVAPSDFSNRQSPMEYLNEAIKHENTLKSIANGVFDQMHPGHDYDPDQERAEVYVDEFLDWAGSRDGSWAACVNLIDAHFPYSPREVNDTWGGSPVADILEDLPDEPMSRTFLQGRPWGQLRALESLYDGCILQLDRAIERLVHELKDVGQWDDTLLVVTSDHGECFGERSRITPEVRLVDHSWGLHELLTHVPLIVKEPHQSDSRDISRLSSLTNFPDVVISALDGGSVAEDFVCGDYALSSTYRVVPPGDELPLDPGEREDYFGPWRAVYTEEENHLLKTAQRRGDETTVEIRDAQTSYVVERESDISVEEIYNGLSDKEVEMKEGEVTDELRNHLSDLGYLR